MEPAVIVAILAAAAVLLMFFGIFGGRRTSPTERIEQVTQAAAQARSGNQSSSGKSLRSRIFSGRAAVGVDRVVERRDWGTNMARELARADLQLRPSEYLALRIAAIVGAPLVAFVMGKAFLPGLDNAIALVVAVLWWVVRA